ncbi:MAG: hypothetical protein O3A02_02000 [bacterium]|nr:hypothetical protein [bacterium]
MRIRAWVTLLLFLPLGLLAAANWRALVAPVDVDLYALTVAWPLWPFVVALPIALAAFYLAAALLDRVHQLRQVAALERQLEEARAAVDRGRESALDAVAARIETRLAGLESVVEGSASGLEQRLSQRIGAVDDHLARSDETQRDRLEAVVARVSAVRDELAADVGEAEDAVLRALRERDRTVDADPEHPNRRALTDGQG